MATIDISIGLICAKCGEELAATGRVGIIRPYFVVEPCENCPPLKVEAVGGENDSE